MVALSKSFSLPAWMPEFLAGQAAAFPSPASRMGLAIALARLNVERETGGPFGAAVFEQESGRLVAVGVNRVVPLRDSALHAELVALSLAEEGRAAWSLEAPDGAGLELVSSAQPCLMCLGACLWSGIRSLVYGAASEAVEAITGFDEGPLHPQWREECAKRGLSVIGGLMAGEAEAVLSRYAASGVIYNGRAGGPGIR